MLDSGTGSAPPSWEKSWPQPLRRSVALTAPTPTAVTRYRRAGAARRARMLGKNLVSTMARYPTVSMADDPGVRAGDGEGAVRLTVRVAGRVQGVGFRDYVRSRGRRLGLVGSATNLADGRVEVVVEGPEAACRTLLDMLSVGHTPGDTFAVTYEWSAALGDLVGFVRR